MTDQFDIQRQLDDAGDELLEKAMDKLEDAKEKAREHPIQHPPLNGVHPSVTRDKPAD